VARGEQRAKPNAWLDTVLNAAWIPGVPEDEAAYLLVLERALLDRRISEFEAQQLVEVAGEARLSGASIARLHKDYLRSLTQEALADGVVAGSEEADLHAVAAALGLTRDDVTAALAWAHRRQPVEPALDAFTLAAGDRIVFTGEISRPRDEWVAEIAECGLASGGITKSTKLVVAADPDSLSGKASKARSYGIPIVDEAAFVRLFDAYRAVR
jgi:DNA polymerase-3 subunit epsilon